MVCKCSIVERLDLLPMAVLLMIGGKLPAQRAKSAHFVGHLPALSKEPGKHQEHKLSGVFSTHAQTHRSLAGILGGKNVVTLFEPFFERAIQQELSELLLRWLKQAPSEVPLREEVVETTAQVISWAIFGPAAQWCRGDQSISKEVMAHHVLAIVVAGLSPVVTVT